jgi:hypothetical protein
MGKTCPCGCGRKLRFGTSGAAAAYVRILADIDAAAPAFAWAVEAELPDEPDWPKTKRSILAVRERGEHLEGWLLARAHGIALPGVTPNLIELRRMMKEYEKASRALVSLWVKNGGASSAA